MRTGHESPVAAVRFTICHAPMTAQPGLRRGPKERLWTNSAEPGIVQEEWSAEIESAWRERRHPQHP